MTGGEIDWSMLEVTQDAQERAQATVAAAVRLQALHAIRLIVVDGVSSAVVARKCGFDIDRPSSAPAAPTFGGVSLADMFGPIAAPTPSSMERFTSWLQAELKKTIEDQA